MEYCIYGVGVTAGVAVLIIVGKFAAPATNLVLQCASWAL
jgi:hypothetical protein